MNYDCPICGQYMDYIATTYRNSPYIDGKCYKKMCFVCAHAPAEHTVDEDGIEYAVFSHKYLHTAEELVSLGSAENLKEAERSLRGVNRKIHEAGVRALNKLRLQRPKQEYEFNDEYEEKQMKLWQKRRK